MRKLTSRTARSLIGTAVFLGIGVFLYLMACRFLKYPDGVNWATGTGMADVRAHKNQYDVVFVGTSTSIANVSCQELYQSFGIAAVCVGEPEQPVFLSKYTLKDMFRSQKPQVVVLDSKAFFYTEAHDIAVEEGEEEFIYHRSIDAISSTAIKKEALETIRKMYPDRFGEIDLWEYYSVMYRSHANWETLDYRNFHGHDLTDCMNGNIALAAVETGRTDEYAASDPEEEEEIDAEIVSQVTEIAQLCEENGAELVITSGYNVFTKARHRAVAELAGQLGVPYLDVNEVIDEIGFDYALDVRSDAHYNLSGAIKWTMYLGGWLKEQFTFPDRREDKAYAWYETQRPVYERQKTALLGKIELLRSLTLETYLRTLEGLDEDEFSVFLSVCGDEPAVLTQGQKDAFSALGFDPEEIAGGRYAAARIGGKVIRDTAEPDGRAAVSGSTKAFSYEAVSSPDRDGEAGIFIDGSQKSQRGDGINVVVCSKTIGAVAATVYFDTGREADPCPRRRKVIQDTEVRITKEVAPNVWEREETQL